VSATATEFRATANPVSEPQFEHAPSPFDWSVMLYGGTCPRTGFEQPAHECRFFKQRREGGAGYTLPGVIARAEDMAEWMHRTRFLVRDTDGQIVHRGVCQLRDPDGYLQFLAKGQRTFERQERRAAHRRGEAA